MVREFKKTGVAAALTGALLATASLSSHAMVQLSTPGDIVLVPYVVCNLNADISQQKNTLVGLITFWKERLGLVYTNGAEDQPVDNLTQQKFAGPYQPAPAILANLAPDAPASLPVRARTGGRLLHWYFYDNRSVHLLDGVIPVTDNDFVRIDWCATIKSTSQETLSGVEGYLLISGGDDRNLLEVPSFAVYGHAYQIVGNWASQAFIPVVPNPYYTLDEFDDPTAGAEANIGSRGGYPGVRRLVSGTDFTDPVIGGSRFRRDIYMRYFLDPALATENKMVFWFNSNEDAVRGGSSKPVAGETYNSEQVYINSFSTVLPNELNIVTSTPTAPAFPGMIHTETDVLGTVVNTGIIRFGVPEVESTVPFTSSGVTFNMLGLGAGDNATQLQTEMATEGEDF